MQLYSRDSMGWIHHTINHHLLIQNTNPPGLPSTLPLLRLDLMVIISITTVVSYSIKSVSIKWQLPILLLALEGQVGCSHLNEKSHLLNRTLL